VCSNAGNCERNELAEMGCESNMNHKDNNITLLYSCLNNFFWGKYALLHEDFICICLWLCGLLQKALFKKQWYWIVSLFLSRKKKKQTETTFYGGITSIYYYYGG